VDGQQNGEKMIDFRTESSLGEVSEANLAVGLIYPPTSNILNALLHTAGRVAAYVFDHGLAGIPRPDDIDAHIRATAYKPAYLDAA
jgi:malate dehydrogenase (oxaloacetate-decarboxylating)(NADP+)